ncbi:DUF427 domain-containing protein [Rhizobium sp. S152]|uniref:DUF427 domain-containing protein n=1 Tax=Rhizobium sp. S152 TaxID=3055038 RepID=UPI0025A9BCEB|nr:DUF427 domain-containing protein [Rhizobium sp. S152]MDM9628526.1 DUF427 domain-containing protein [Rhizobium sp. S152]
MLNAAGDRRGKIGQIVSCGEYELSAKRLFSCQAEDLRFGRLGIRGCRFRSVESLVLRSYQRQFPGHNLPITLEPNDTPVSIVSHGHCVATSKQAIFVYQAGFSPRIVVPLRDVGAHIAPSPEGGLQRDLIGKRTYWDLIVDGQFHERVGWSYHEIVPGLAGLTDHMVFDTDAIDEIRAGN